jgi:flagellar basal body-associated protein FliL
MKREGRLPILLVIVAAIAAGAAAAGISALMMQRVVVAPPEKQKMEVVPVTFFYSLGEQTVNLREPGRYLKVGIELEVLAKGGAGVEHHAPKSGKEGGEGKEGAEANLPPLALATKAELDEKRAKILDVVIEELSASSFKDLLTPQGRRQLRERLRTAINRILSSGEVQQVYFTSFLAQ